MSGFGSEFWVSELVDESEAGWGDRCLLGGWEYGGRILGMEIMIMNEIVWVRFFGGIEGVLE